jgi:hypothetical protein
MAQGSGQIPAPDKAALMWYQRDSGRWSSDAQRSALTFHVSANQPMREAMSPYPIGQSMDSAFATSWRGDILRLFMKAATSGLLGFDRSIGRLGVACCFVGRARMDDSSVVQKAPMRDVFMLLGACKNESGPTRPSRGCESRANITGFGV